MTLFRLFFCPVIFAKTRNLTVVFRFYIPVSGNRSSPLDKILSQYSEKATNWTIREKGKKIFSFSKRPDWFWASPDPIVPMYFSPDLELSGRKADR
jgi:hypothetical protein